MSGRGQAAAVILAALAGGLGLLPGAAGALDPVSLLAWLALLAPAAGIGLGALGVRLLPYGAAVPGVWSFLLVWAETSSSRDLAAPLYGCLVAAGLFAGGLGIGARLGGRSATAEVRAAGAAAAALLAGVLLSGLAVQGGLGPEETPSWARSRPGLVAFLLDVSPIVFVLESAGWDVVHAQPQVYRRAAVEWHPRRPYRGRVAAPTALVVGCLFALFLPRRSPG